MRIFRYFSFNRGYEVLNKKQLYACSIYDVNDPFEVTTNIDSEAYKGKNLQDILLKEHNIKRSYEEKIKSIYLPFKSFKKIYIENIDKLVKEKEKEIIANNNISYAKENFQNTFSKYWKIICCSKIYNSILMWSHYTKNHSGIVLEFNSKDEYISKLKNYIFPVEYKKEKPTYFHTPEKEYFEKSILNIAGTKFIDWKYEEEIRLVIPRGYLKQDKYYDISNKVIKSIYLGLKISDEDKDKIFSLLENEEYSHLDIFQAKMHPSEYSIEFTKLNF